MANPTVVLAALPSVTAFRNWLVRSRAWISLLILLPFAVLALLSTPLADEGTWLDFFFDSAAWLTFAAGATFRWWATLYIGGRKTQTLSSEGPYSLCRNPLYVGTVLAALAIGLFLQSLTLCCGMLFAATCYLSITVPVEERFLSEKFGESYREYCRRVPRYWPRWSTFRTSDAIEVNVSGLVAEGWRAARWIWIPILGNLIAQLRAEAWWPKWLHLL